MAPLSMMVYCVVLLLAVVCLTEATSCYKCRNGRTNEECNSGPIQTCGQWKYRSVMMKRSDNACEVEIYTIHGRKIIKKQCIDGSQCHNQNIQCDSNGRRCSYCCFGDLCNQHESPSVPSTTTTSRPTHHTSPTTPHTTPTTRPTYHTSPTTPHTTPTTRPTYHTSPTTPHTTPTTRPTYHTSPTTPHTTPTTRPHTTPPTTYHTSPTTQHPTGPPGPMGPPGLPGRPGFDGLPGRKGEDGLPGLTRIKGAAGGPGQIGYPGLPGLPGESRPGPKGAVGWPGPTGPKGQPGHVDPNAVFKGEKGDYGFPGLDGLMGQKGQEGDCDCAKPIKEAVVSFTVVSSDVEQTSDSYEHIPIESVITNITNVGNVGLMEYMDFTAPVAGIYVFHVTSIANGNGAVPLVLFQDSHEEIVMTGRSDRSATGPYPVGIAHTTLELRRGQLVSLVVREKRQGFFWGVIDIYSKSEVTFSGYLLAPLPAQ